VCSFEDSPNVVMISYTFQLFCNSLHIGDRNKAKRLFLFLWMTTALGIRNEPMNFLGKPMSQRSHLKVVNFIKQILAFLACGRSTTVETNYSSFNMWRMIRFKNEVVASVGRFSINFSGQCGPLSDNKNILKGNCTA
jgi:hypothetical protein